MHSAPAYVRATGPEICAAAGIRQPLQWISRTYRSQRGRASRPGRSRSARCSGELRRLRSEIARLRPLLELTPGRPRRQRRRGPAMRGGLRTDIRRAERDYLPLTAEVVAPHTSRNKRIALYPLGGDWVLEANFDGPDAMIDALMYPEAARTPGVPQRLCCCRCALREGRRASPRRTHYFAAPVIKVRPRAHRR